ncbi:MAG TPA: hypothetical protein VGK87_09870 [Anaerolineae bacterium]
MVVRPTGVMELVPREIVNVILAKAGIHLRFAINHGSCQGETLDARLRGHDDMSSRKRANTRVRPYVVPPARA